MLWGAQRVRGITGIGFKWSPRGGGALVGAAQGHALYYR